MIDLHFHSKYSDGKLSIKKIANILIESGIKYCSLTDHDTVNGLREMKKTLKNTDIIFIPGVEMTALYNNNEIHILIYDFDIDKAIDILELRNKLVEKQRIKELKATIGLFKTQGLLVSDNLRPTPKQSIGLTVALDIYNKKENQKLLAQKHGCILSEEDFYNFYQARGCSCYVPKSGVEASWVIKKFASLTKNIIVAHPFVSVSFTTKPLKKENIVELIDMGITGIEIYHDRNSKEQIRFLEKFVAKNNLFYTGGSDSHFRQKDAHIGYYNSKNKILGFRLHNIYIKDL